MTTPREQGRAAYERGYGIDKDPFRGVFAPWYGTNSPESAAWRVGYMDAWSEHGGTLTARAEAERLAYVEPTP